MKASRWVPTPALAALAAALPLCGAARAEGKGVEPDDLRRGLVTTARDSARPAAHEVVTLEPTVALALGPGESPHPRLRPGGGSVVWKGYLNVLRAGPHRFSVRLRGRFRLSVAGKEVLAGEVKGDRPALKEGPEVKLEAGAHPLVAEFTRPAGVARVELWWQSPYFRREPLPHDFVGHLPAEVPPALKAHSRVEEGRRLAEEGACTSCHKPDPHDSLARGLVLRKGPDLSASGKRLHADWLAEWLDSPRKLRPRAAMPDVFPHDEEGRLETYAVTAYLTSLGGPLRANRHPPPQDQRRDAARRGRRLYTSLGCIACHGERDLSGDSTPKAKEKHTPRESARPGPALLYSPPEVYPLGDLARQTTPEKLAEYLLNPLALNPAGRMPHMLLQGHEAQELAYFLCGPGTKGGREARPPAPAGKEQRLAAFKRVEARPAEVTAFERLDEPGQWRQLGKRLVSARGCVNCHTVAPGGKPLPARANKPWDELKKPASHDSGCLAPTAAKRGGAPDFHFTNDQRSALSAFLTKGSEGAGAPAPAYRARRALERFNCLACHTRDGEGGLAESVVGQLRKFEGAENAEAVIPPPLTGVGHKLRTPWLRDVLLHAGRARPWMGLRMPQFGPANVGGLPEDLASLEGAEPDHTVRKVPLSAALLRAGRELVSKNALGCVSCHDIAGIPNRGTRGPDLAGMNQRVRYEWYRRWLEQPQRISPGTRMPTVFMEGKSLVEKVLAGKADAQADAMWGYLSLGVRLPLPEGLEPGRMKGIEVLVKDRPELLRTFLPDCGPRGIAVGFPGGVSSAFDAGTCRLAYAWSGKFLDSSPVWADRGGNPARLLGPRFWKAPAGCPVGLTSSDDPPDFAARARDPAYGGPVPEGKLYAGPVKLRFRGYSVDRAGVPTFRYELRDAETGVLVRERVDPLRKSVAVGIARRFRIDAPAGRGVWLLAADSPREPRRLGEKGATSALDLKSGKLDLPAGTWLALPQDGDRVVVLAAKAPEGTRWRVRRSGGGWQVLLHVPARTSAGTVSAGFDVWAPFGDEPALLKELVGK